MTRPQTGARKAVPCSIENANRLYARTDNVFLVITGWDDADVVAGRTPDEAVLIENALSESNSEYVPVQLPNLPD